MGIRTGIPQVMRRERLRSSPVKHPAINKLRIYVLLGKGGGGEGNLRIEGEQPLKRPFIAKSVLFLDSKALLLLAFLKTKNYRPLP
jgi:hypothetical protein